MTTGLIQIGGKGPEDYAFLLRSWSGSNDPKKKADNPYSLVRIHVTRSKTTQYYEQYGVPHETTYFEYDGTDAYAPSSLWTSNDEIALTSKLASAVRGHDFNAGVAVAEMPQTIKLLTDRTASFFKAYRYAKKGRFGDSLRALGKPSTGNPRRPKKLTTSDVSSFWLEIQYGWKPLLNDIYEAAKVIESNTSGPRSYTFRCSRSVRSRQNTAANGSGVYEIMTDLAYTVSLRAKFFEPPSTARSLGLLNPLAVAWEKVPFSFVVDWFIPIGNYLDTAGFFLGYDNYTCTRSVLRTGNGALTKLRSPYSIYTWVGGSYTHRSVKFDRIPNYTIVVPRPGFKPIEQALSLGHLKNAAALIWGNIHKA